MTMRLIGAGLVFAMAAMLAFPAAALNIRVPPSVVAAIPAAMDHSRGPTILRLNAAEAVDGFGFMDRVCPVKGEGAELAPISV